MWNRNFWKNGGLQLHGNLFDPLSTRYNGFFSYQNHNSSVYAIKTTHMNPPGPLQHLCLRYIPFMNTQDPSKVNVDEGDPNGNGSKYYEILSLQM